MGKLLELLAGPTGGLVGAVGDIIDGLHTSNEEKLQAKQAMVMVQMDFHRQLLAADQAWAETQAEVITTEAQSQSVLARNWRPILMLVFTYIIAHNYVFGPLLGITTVPVPPPMWQLLQLGVGGYIVGRSAEKIIPKTFGK
jgi:hypothetical protein